MKEIVKKFSVFLTLFLAACGSSTTGDFDGKNFELDGLDLQYPEGWDSDSDQDGDRLDGEATGKVLTFVLENDDYGQTCKGKLYCNIKLTYKSKRSIDVIYTEGGKPVPSVAISYEILNDTLGAGKLAAMTSYTEDNGIAPNEIENVKQVVTQFQVKVCVSNDPSVPCIYFNIGVVPKDIIPLTVIFDEYSGNYLLDTGVVRLFKQNQSGEPKCSSLKYDSLPTATLSSPKQLLTQSFHFLELPDLDKELVQKYTVFGLANYGTGPTLAYACDDINGKVEFGGQSQVILTLKDVFPKIAGSYDVISQFDLVSGLPPDIEMVVNAIIGFFQNPTAQIMLLICQLSYSSLDDMCGWFFNNPGEPDIDDLTSTGEIAFKIMNAILLGIIQQNCPFDDKTLCGKIYWTGKDVGDILKKLELRATFKFKAEPDENGYIPKSATEEIWHTVTFKWTLGKDCPPDDDNCGKVNFSFSSIPGIEETITGNFEAQLQKVWDLTIVQHTLKLKYGALVNFAIEKMLLTMLFGDGSDGLPAVDSYEKMIGSLLAGKQCLVNWDCCEKFAEELTKQAFGLTKNLVEGACDALITTGSTYLRNMLMSLDTEPDNFSIGTKEPCKTYDTKNKMKIDALGNKMKQCLWDAKLKVGGSYYDPYGTFYGTAKQ